jgi:hypothetical protein
MDLDMRGLMDLDMHGNLVEWAGKEMLDPERGRIVYSAVHAWADGRALCGTREPVGDWISEQDSTGEPCKRCVAKSEEK